MSELSEWLEPRLTGAPSTLRERILAAVDADGDSRFPLPASRSNDAREPTDSESPAPRSLLSDHLRDLAEQILEDVKNAGDSAVALDLLAADALITFACEALAESDPGGLAEIK